AFREQAVGVDVMFSPEGRWLASAAGTTVKVWDVMTGKVVATLDNPGGTITRLVFSPDGRRLAVANSEGTVRLWDVEPESSARGREAVENLQKLLTEERRRSRALLNAAQRKEEAARRDAERAREQAQRMLYASQIALAQRAWEAGKAEEAVRQLESVPPEARGWEWHFLKRCASRSKEKGATSPRP